MYIFKISRERSKKKNPQHSTITRLSGEKLRKSLDGVLTPEDFVYEVLEKEGKKHIHISAPNEKKLKQLLQKAKKEFPNIDTEDALKNAIFEPEYIYEPVLFQMTTQRIGAPQSLTKTILAFACYIGIDIFQSSNLIGFLNNQNTQNFYQPYYVTDVIQDRPPLPFHCIGISNQNLDGLLLGYIEYFGAYRYLFKLSDHWDTAQAIHQVYTIDPISGTAIDLTMDLSLSKEMVVEVLADRSDPFAEIKKSLEAVIPLGLPDPLEALQNMAIDHAFKECGVKPGQDLSHEKYQAFSGICADKLIQLLMKHGFMNTGSRKIRAEEE